MALPAAAEINDPVADLGDCLRPGASQVPDYPLHRITHCDRADRFGLDPAGGRSPLRLRGCGKGSPQMLNSCLTSPSCTRKRDQDQSRSRLCDQYGYRTCLFLDLADSRLSEGLAEVHCPAGQRPVARTTSPVGKIRPSWSATTSRKSHCERNHGRRRRILIVVKARHQVPPARP